MLRKTIVLIVCLCGAISFAQRNKEKDSIKQLDEVVVTATRVPKALKNVPITVQVVTAEDIRKSHSIDFKSFLETEFSGINFTYNGGMPNINMMGFDGKYVLFLINGERMAGEAFDNVDYDRLNLDNIERIEVIKGAASSLYGSNALGGVINIITKKVRKPFEGNVGYVYDTSEGHKTNLTVGTNQKWFDLSVASFYRKRDPYVITDKEPLVERYENGTIKSQYSLNSMNVAGFTVYNVEPTVRLKFSPKADISITPNYYFSERKGGVEVSEKLRDRYYNYGVQGSSNIDLGERSHLELSGSYDRYDKFNYYVIPKEQEKKYQNVLWRGGAQFNSVLFGNNTTVLGIETQSDELLDKRFTNSTELTRQQAQTYSAFLQQDIALTESLSLVAGARYDYHDLFKGFPTYRLTAMYRVEPFTFRGGYASGFRSPTLKELYSNWFHPWGGGFQIVGNENLKPEKSDNLTFSVDYSYGKFDFTAITQYSKVHDKIDNTEEKDANGKLIAIKKKNLNGNSTIVSSELSATYRPSKSFRLKASYGYHNMDRRRSEIRPHTVTFKAEYIPKREALYIPNVIVTGKYVSDTKLYSEDTDKKLYYAEYEGYNEVHLQLSSRLPYHFTLSAGVNNVFDYTPNVVGFYSSITPGRTYYVGLKWIY